MIVFDIETGPLPDDQLFGRADPFVAPERPGEFDESAVKLGNLKDKAKIAAKIAAAREDHAKAVASHEVNVKRERQEWEEGVRSKAALSATTGRVLAVGYLSTDTGAVILDIDASEEQMLDNFWNQYQRAKSAGRRMVGHNIGHFDLPFLAQRSWMLGVDTPDDLLDRGKWLNAKVFVDTMVMWTLGTGRIKLDTLAKVCGFDGKPEGMDGGMFADTLKTDRQKAEEYLRGDLRMTASVATRMGIL